jgi:hypothetical protein
MGSPQTGWLVSDEPGIAQVEWALASDRGFATSAWAHVVEGLGCKVKYAWNADISVGLVMPVFRRGPLKIAFLGFPVAGQDFDRFDFRQQEQAQHLLCDATHCDLVRSVRSGVCSPSATPGTLQPEVWIDDLSTWPRGGKGKRIDKDVAFAMRATAKLTPHAGLGDPVSTYSMYRQTILRHGGRTRYTLEYFRRMRLLCSEGGVMRGLSYCDEQGRTVAFGISARHGDTCYYLHGAVDETARSTGVADLILFQLISQGRSDGATRFSLMASPRDQPGLVKYKKKWGDNEGFAHTVDAARGPLGKMLLWWLRRR